MILQELIKIVKDNNLIETVSDINFLFLNYQIEDELQPINHLIDDVLNWGYENDELEEFYLEHTDFLIESGKVDYIISCTIELNTSVRTITTFEMYCFESKNLLYYRVIGSGEYSDCWDTSGFYQILNRKSNSNIISIFKEECNNVFTNNGEFNNEDLISENNSIVFYFP